MKNSFFSVSTSSWRKVADCTFTQEDAKNCIECKAVLMTGKHGEFAKVFISIQCGNNIMRLNGDKGSDGKEHYGVILSEKYIDDIEWDENNEAELDLQEIRVRKLKHTETGQVITRCDLI